MKSPVPYLTDEKYSALPLPERALHVARSQVGEREVPKGSNFGGMVTAYLKASGWISPAAWCAAFAVWCIVQAGGKKSLLWTSGLASTWFLYDWAKRKGRLSTEPKRGDLFVWSTPKGGHTGFVVEVYRTRGVLHIRTIEGNTNDEGSREGYEVCERRRSITELQSYKRFGFINLGGLDR
jgi:hypothetical protein